MRGLLNIGMQDIPVPSYPKHFHKNWEITYYYKGTGYNITGGNRYDFTEGTIICQPPFLDHEDYSACGSSNIFFCVQDFSLDTKMPIVFQDTTGHEFFRGIKQMYSEFYIRGKQHGRMTDALLNVLYQYILDFLTEISSNPYVALLRQEIIDNLSNAEFSITSAMRRYPICIDYLRRQFISEIGTSPQQFLKSIRLSNAKQLLCNSSLPLKTISKMCGYDDPLYFSRVFKTDTALSPASWRSANG